MSPYESSHIDSLPLHERHDLRVTVLTVSPNSALCASGSEDGTVILWNISDGTLVQELLAHAEPVRGLAFSPDSLRLASYDGISGLAVWDVESGAQLIKLPWHGNFSDSKNSESIFTCAWSPDGATVMAGAEHHNVVIWDANTYDELWTFRSRELACARYSPDGRCLVSQHRGVFSWIWGDPHSCRRDVVREGPSAGIHPWDRIMEIVFDPTSTWMATVSQHGLAHVWDIVQVAEEDRPMAVVDGSNMGGIRRAAVSADGELRCVMGNGRVKLLSPTDGERWSKDSRDDPLPSTTSTCISADGNLVAFAFAEGPDIELRSVSRGRCIQMFRGCHSASTKINELIFSPDASVLCSGAEDGTVVIHRLYDFMNYEWW